MQGGNWSKIGGKSDWGSFDFVTTDPTRSNSGQMTLELWAQSRSGNLNNINLNNPATETLFSLIKRSVYQPPRSQKFNVCGKEPIKAMFKLALTSQPKTNILQIYFLEVPKIKPLYRFAPKAVRDPLDQHDRR
ncbi:MAG: hypothetical protein MUD14_09870 [Hydrococcus sp. Prado102]|jgi:hypothetical protein|nr:hypothetical protein [Hydrococcus sp. Prado102]